MKRHAAVILHFFVTPVCIANCWEAPFIGGVVPENLFLSSQDFTVSHSEITCCFVDPSRPWYPTSETFKVTRAREADDDAHKLQFFSFQVGFHSCKLRIWISPATRSIALTVQAPGPITPRNSDIAHWQRLKTETD
jgi:hypothetical protein